MKAYGYCRVSTGKQAVQGVSLEVQEEKIRQWCKLHDHELVEVFSDRGITGTNRERRRGLQNALKATCGSKGVLVFYDLTRLARSLKDASEIFDTIKESGGHLASCTEPFDSTAVGQLMFSILSAFAQFNSRLTGEKVRASGQLRRKQMGYRTMGMQPYGYTYDVSAGQRVEVANEQAIMKVARKLLETKTYDATAQELNARGYVTRRGGKWHSATVRRALAGVVKA